MNQKELDEILKQHRTWHGTDGSRGKKADLCGEDLSNKDFHCSILHDADFTGANLKGANLRETSLHRANFEGANLEEADLKGAFVDNKPTPFLLGNQIIFELENPYRNGDCSWNRIKKWTKLNKHTEELFL